MPSIKSFYLAIPLAAVCAAQSTSPPHFTITQIPPLAGMQSSAVLAMSQSGLAVVGVSGPASSIAVSVPNTGLHGFLYLNGKLTDLGVNNTPVAANSSGGVAIQQYDQSNSYTGSLLYQNGSSQALPIFGEAIDEAGEVAGSSDSDDLNTSLGFPVLFSKGAITKLPFPMGGNGEVSGASSNGILAGWVVAPGGSYTPAIWNKGILQTLPTGKGHSGFALYVNSSGVAAGRVQGGTTTGFNGVDRVVFQGNSVTDLTDLIGSTDEITLQGINDSGWVVGYHRAPSSDATFVSPQGVHPFLFAGGKVYDLNTQVDNASGWTLVSATGVNNAGQIAGNGYLNGQLTAFLLTPVVAPPPPMISAVTGAGLSVPAVRQLTTDGLFTIFGSNFTASMPHPVGSADLVGGALPTNLSQTCVLVGNTRAPLTFVSAMQINAEAPVLPASGNVAVSVIADCDSPNAVTSATFTVSAAAAAPEFLYFVTNSSGNDPVVAVDATTGTLVGSPGLISGLTFEPAQAGDVLTIYGVGFGATSSPVDPGALATSALTTAGQATVTIGGTDAPVLYCGVTPGYAGLYQLNVEVPSGLAAGSQQVVINVNGGTSPSDGFLTLQ